MLARKRYEVGQQEFHMDGSSDYRYPDDHGSVAERGRLAYRYGKIYQSIFPLVISAYRIGSIVLR